MNSVMTNTLRKLNSICELQKREKLYPSMSHCRNYYTTFYTFIAQSNPIPNTCEEQSTS